MISPMKNTLMINTSNQNGFTLVELMIVIAIVGIIATVGYPSFINVSHLHIEPQDKVI
jgi:prepilin-type N-terminal cleavage/methylation domain-containing protein